MASIRGTGLLWERAKSHSSRSGNNFMVGVSGLEHLVSEGIVSEVLGRLQSGKEAEVFVVRYGSKAVVAKVYKDRAHRNFKNNAAYTEGRTVRNTRSQRAMDRGTRFGQAAAEDAWKEAEVQALYKLHAAGVRVPAPVIFLEGVLLMELVCGADGEAARRLIETDLTVEQARAAYHDMLGQLVRMLSCDLVHGDLSPYNVLWGAQGPTLIDFPQMISAAHNRSAESFFLRDARNILGHFVAIDPSLASRSGDPADIWRAYVRRELTPDFVPSGRPELRMAPQQGGGARSQHDGQRSAQQQQRGPRPQHGGGPRPQQGGGPRPQQGGGPRPQQGGGPRPQQGGGPRPQQGGGPRPQQGGGPRPQQGGGGSRGRRPLPEIIVQNRRPPPTTTLPEGPDTPVAVTPHDPATAGGPPRRRRRRR